MARKNKWPTPHGFSQDGRSNGPSGNELGRAVNQAMFPTPTAAMNMNSPSMQKWAAHRNFATPCNREYRGAGRSRMERRGEKNGENLPQQIGGSLNPTWVEWLMGFPLEWTALKHWATRSSRKSRKSSGAQ
jgi:hypothetical protein